MGRLVLIHVIMDMVFSSPVHQDPLLVVDIIDDAWAAETLPVEDVVVAPDDITNLEEDDPSTQHEEHEDDKWNDLALEEFTSNISAQANNSESTAPRSPPFHTPNQCR